MEPTSLGLRDYGERLNGPRDYEWNLARESEGRRRFKDLVVHRQSITDPAGGSREAWIVSGLYCGNAPDPADGAWQWRAKYFVADEPYKPAIPLSQLTGVTGTNRIAEFAKLPRPNVMDYLEILHDTRGVQFHHAWWRTYAMATGFLGSLVLIGLAAPTAIDLIVFGRLIRPREKKEIERPSSPAAAPVPKPGMTAEDMKELQALDAAMEEGLKATASTKKAATAATPAAAAPIRKLSDAPQAVAALPETDRDRAFGAKPGDYYPTERKTHG
jgi:hypothetical protein